MNGLIDIHTHILPKMDDGSKDTQMSIAMLRAEAEQGVKTVVLTPHYYPLHEERERFLHRRRDSYEALLAAIEQLPEQEQQKLPQMVLGAEVAWCMALPDRDMRPLCIGNSHSLLLELPTDAWDQKMVNEIYNLQTHQGILPIFAHFDRYILPENKEIIPQLYEMHLPIQLGSEPFLDFFERRQVLSMIKKGHGHLVASDCHDMDSRKPNLQKALHVIEKKLGQNVADNMCRSAQNLIEA